MGRGGMKGSANDEATQSSGEDEPQQSKKTTKLPRPEGKFPCPRCSSDNTKFCYYNNYNIKQPRFYCKVRWLWMRKTPHSLRAASSGWQCFKAKARPARHGTGQCACSVHRLLENASVAWLGNTSGPGCSGPVGMFGVWAG